MGGALTVTGIAMSKCLSILLLPIALAGCTVGHVTLPMTLGPSDTPKASCLTYADAARVRRLQGARQSFHSPREEIDLGNGPTHLDPLPVVLALAQSVL